MYYKFLHFSIFSQTKRRTIMQVYFLSNSDFLPLIGLEIYKLTTLKSISILIYVCVCVYVSPAIIFYSTYSSKNIIGKLPIWSLTFSLCVNLVLDLSNVSVWSLLCQNDSALNNKSERFPSIRDQIDTIPKN